MLFQIYGERAGFQMLGWLLVFLGLILTNEIARRSKKGGIFFKREGWEHSTKNIVAFGCLLGCVAYMVCGLFSDSTLYTSPVFYVFAGIVLSATNDK